MQIGHKISQLRMEKNISQKQLAADIHVSAGLVGLWETNKRVPSLESFVTLIDYFAVDADLLLEFDRKLPPGHYKKYMGALSSPAEKLLNTFLRLNEDNQDILIGEAKKLLKSQIYEENGKHTPPKKTI